MKILLVQLSIEPPGGGNLVAAWMLQALRDEHDVSLFTWDAPDLDVCNEFFGTSLRSSDFELMLVNPVVRRLARWTPTPMSLLKNGYLLRQAAGVADRYDVVITANNESDLGRPGIQYIHYPKLDPVRPAAEMRWYHASHHLLGLYYRAYLRLGRFSRARMNANLTLVNSRFIGERVESLHGVRTETLHPPVPREFPAVPWEARTDSFVAIGRISPEKRFEHIIEILSQVRAQGHAVSLRIIGNADDRAYGRRILSLVQRNATWVSLSENLPSTELVQVVAQQRYGLHAMVDEHFGIAVAEMIRAGCIVFAPNSGGPLEIVGSDSRLLFDSTEDAVRKIVATLRDAELQTSLRAHLARRAPLFTTTHFVTRLRDIVRTFGHPSSATG